MDEGAVLLLEQSPGGPTGESMPAGDWERELSE
jgi:hypothetical protein